MDKEISSFYALVFRQKFIERWGLMRSLVPESLAVHSSECAILTHALATIGNELFGRNYDVGKAVIMALFHDVPEVFTGDMPTPVKYANDEIRAEFGKIEEKSIENLVSKLPKELRPIYKDIIDLNDAELKKIVKAADRLCAYIKCADEMKLNNMEYRSAKEGIEQKLKETSMPELDYFMEKFLPAFELTLDEQQK